MSILQEELNKEGNHSKLIKKKLLERLNKIKAKDTEGRTNIQSLLRREIRFIKN